ncbi:hypothetical protein DL764_004046 [Monosporascus ibericus]|uniref:mRNA-capping enzyme subunit beta n=1 Tax=Monosporascus ibericus TaxID=155417 RepID=A0A4Q4TEA4_9PEZI|nr:hypothetical protein DL764_004046 [Monosporascus ibericus]
MDLRAMLNTDGGADRGGAGTGGAGGATIAAGGNAGASSRHPSQPPSGPAPGSLPSPSLNMSGLHGPSTQSVTPATPVQAGPSQNAFRDYSHSAHASPVMQHREYPAAAGPYQSPTSYHPTPSSFVGNRPSGPPIRPPNHAARSPGGTSMPAPSPSYRQTPPVSSISTGSQGYPFPPASQTPLPASPNQRQQYGSQGGYTPRDSYPSQRQSPAPPIGMPRLSGHGSVALSYGQGQQQEQCIPQTPPVGTPGGGAPPYVQQQQQQQHQRSLSTQSIPTPTSAHSQQPPYGPSYMQGSPVAPTHQAPPQLQHLDHHQSQRQTSQPPTPLGPPMPGPVRQSPAASYREPPSPYQQRISSSATTTTATYPPQVIQTSPPPPSPASIQQQQQQQQQQRTTNSIQREYEAFATELQQRPPSQSRSERERSISVSPKTRVSSIPSSAGQDVHTSPQFHRPQAQSQPTVGSLSGTTMDPPRELTTPAKRKLDDRNLSPGELQNNRRPPPPTGANGDHVPPPQTTAHKRIRHTTLPIWAQPSKGRHLNASRNFSLKQHLNQGLAGKLVNGNTHHEGGGSVKSEHTSRHSSPEATRPVPAAVPVKVEDHAVTEHANAEAKETKTFGGKSFPWEPTIENQKPIDVFSRTVGDFLFFNVLSNPNLEEIRSRNVQFEIEAKLGTVVDKSTNDRIHLPVRAGECVMNDEARIAFRSSMTEGQHRMFNQWLNHQVQESHRAPSRLEVNYKHRREVDRFFELPTSQFIQRLPHCVSALLPPSSTLKARVTYDQQTGNVLAKIIKGRVADLNVHFPHLPLDCRISVNLEWEWEGDAEEIVRGHIANRERQPDRNKDRLSYTHGFYQIDLTQVTQGDGAAQGGRPPDKEHELEVELHAGVIMEHGNLLMKSLPNRFENLVDGFVDNIRILAKRCPAMPQ